MPEIAYTFFIAHAGADTPRALALRDLLADKVAVYVDAQGLTAGSVWNSALAEAQQRSLATLVLLSPAWENAFYLREEIAAAIDYQRADPARHRAIPVWLDGRPGDPLKIPYGLRTLHSLDAQALGGLQGLANKLVEEAAQLKGAPPPAPTATVRPAPADRFEVLDALCRLMPAQFEEVLFRASPPKHQQPPASEPLGVRAINLLHWAEQDADGGLNALVAVVRRVAPKALRAAAGGA